MEAPRLGRKDRSQFWPKRQFPAAKAPTPARPAPAPRFASPWLLLALTAGMKGPKPPNTCCLWGLCCCCWGWACWGWGPPKPRNLVLGAGTGAGAGAGAGAGGGGGGEAGGAGRQGGGRGGRRGSGRSRSCWRSTDTGAEEDLGVGHGHHSGADHQEGRGDKAEVLHGGR